jgi:predicted ATP-grasp superfamily ATP-dependent carboligase
MWHSLAAASGVNLSLVAYRDAIGKPYVATRQADGRKWVVAITDIRDAQAEFRRGERSVLPWLMSYAGVVQDGVLSLRDPVPGLLAAGRALQSVARRGASKDTEQV